MSDIIKKQKLSSIMLYELRNICGNPYIYIFGFAMPIMLVLIFSMVTQGSTTKEVQMTINTSLFASISMVIPLAIILLGCAATSAQEMEKKVPLRFKLFGFSERKIILARFFGEMILVTVALLLYCVVCLFSLKIMAPVWWAVIIWLACFYLLSTISFLLAYGIASIFQKFGITYCICMILYFASMIFSGMMGISIDQMPEPMRKISGLLPTSYLTKDIMDFWQGGKYNFMPMIQSYLFIAAISGIILYFAVYRQRRVLK